MIENSIQCAEFYKNRFFIASKHSLLYPDYDAILPEYKENIEHWSEHIPELFRRKKQDAFEALLKIDKINELLKAFIECVDPIEACYIAEEFCCDFGRSFRLPEIFDENFYYAAKSFKEMVGRLRDDGILDNFIFLKKHLLSEVNSYLNGLQNRVIDENTIHKIEFRYNPITFNFIDLSNSLHINSDKEQFKDYSKFDKAVEGILIFSWKFGLTVARTGSVQMNEACIGDLMEKVYALKYYEDEEITGD